MAKNPIPQKVLNLASAIINLITTHEGKTSSSTQKGHAYAGGAPQSIGTSLSAGTDNGYYARADHVHTVDYSNILNKPSTFAPSAHNHDNTYYTKGEVDSLLNNILLDRIFLDEYGNLVIGTTINGMLLTGNKNIIQSNETSTLTATAYDAYSDIVQDEPLQLYKDNVLVGIYNTDENGQITYTYTGNGSGKHNFYVQNGRFQSEPYTLWDTLFYDKATTGKKNSHWTYSTSNITEIVGDEYTTLATSNANSTTGRYTSTDTFTGDFEVLIEVNLPSTNSCAFYVGVRDTANTQWQINVTGWRYIKYGRSNGTYYAKISEDSSTWSDMTVTSDNAGTGAVSLLLLLYNVSGNERTVQFRNIKVYSI